MTSSIWPKRHQGRSEPRCGVMSKMRKSEIQIWLAYWQNANMVSVDAIRALEHVYQARKYCACMRQGVFHPDLVSDGQIWDALQAMRLGKEAAACFTLATME